MRSSTWSWSAVAAGGGRLHPPSPPAGAELGLELARKINSGPWIPPQEVSFPEQRRGEVGPEELAKRQREVWRAKGGGLIAPLLKELVDLKVEVRTSTPAVALVDDG